MREYWRCGEASSAAGVATLSVLRSAYPDSPWTTAAVTMVYGSNGTLNEVARDKAPYEEEAPVPEQSAYYDPAPANQGIPSYATPIAAAPAYQGVPSYATPVAAVPVPRPAPQPNAAPNVTAFDVSPPSDEAAKNDQAQQNDSLSRTISPAERSAPTERSAPDSTGRSGSAGRRGAATTGRSGRGSDASACQVDPARAIAK